MKEIRDCRGRLACVGDSETGKIETVYKGQTTCFNVPVGEAFSIERQGVKTYVTRTSTSDFSTYSYAMSE